MTDTHNKTENDDLRGAYHEAGHAVAFYASGWHLRPGFQITAVFLRNADGQGCSPHCSFTPPAGIRAQAERVMVDLAGLIAEKHYADEKRRGQASSLLAACRKLDASIRDPDPSLAWTDATAAIYKLNDLCNKSGAPASWEKKATKIVNKIERGMLRNRSAIEAVAEHLLKTRRMTGDEINICLKNGDVVHRFNFA
jgi:hypothetical protein